MHYIELQISNKKRIEQGPRIIFQIRMQKKALEAFSKNCSTCLEIANSGNNGYLSEFRCNVSAFI